MEPEDPTAVTDEYAEAPVEDATYDATSWPMASPGGENLQLDYNESGTFTYSTGERPEGDPFADWDEAAIDAHVGQLDALAQGETPAPGVGVGEYQQGNIAPFDPAMNDENWRNPLSPPGEMDYVPGETPGSDSYHGSMGQRLERQQVGEDGQPVVDENGQPVMEEHFVAAEEFAITPAHATYAVRVGQGGSFVDHVFDSKEEAIVYADELSQRGEDQIRQDSALPEQWPGGAAGNPVDAARVFEIPPNTPFLRSGVAPQPESTPGMTEVYVGGGAQTQLPYGTLKAPKTQPDGTVRPGSPSVAEFPIEQQ